MAGFDHCKLTNVQVTDNELGRGSHAVILELCYNGLKCAGKKIHGTLVEEQHGDQASIVNRFEYECALLSQTRHPNIIQFLGVHFEPGAKLPILVMEYLPTNLTKCIEEHGILPKEEIYSILHDVALGLHYLHSQSPPIIHRDLSSNNVLLTCSMRAKISDLGTARILNLAGLDDLSIAPGTQLCMPPEALTNAPQYDTCIDVFSYGILMIHILTGTWPKLQGTDADKAEKRGKYLEIVGQDHPLMDLVLKCIHTDRHQRAHSGEIVGKIGKVIQQYPQIQGRKTQIEMLEQIRVLQGDAAVRNDVAEAKPDSAVKLLSLLAEKEETIKSLVADKEDTIAALFAELEDAIKSMKTIQEGTINRQELAHSAEVEQLKQEIETLSDMKREVSAEKKVVEEECNRLKSELKDEVELKQYIADVKNEIIERREELRLKALDHLKKISTYLTANKQVSYLIMQTSTIWWEIFVGCKFSLFSWLFGSHENFHPQKLMPVL